MKLKSAYLLKLVGHPAKEVEVEKGAVFCLAAKKPEDGLEWFSADGLQGTIRLPGPDTVGNGVVFGGFSETEEGAVELRRRWIENRIKKHEGIIKSSKKEIAYWKAKP